MLDIRDANDHASLKKMFDCLLLSTVVGNLSVCLASARHATADCLQFTILPHLQVGRLSQRLMPIAKKKICQVHQLIRDNLSCLEAFKCPLSSFQQAQASSVF
jgi:hypothetical protein